MIQSFGNKTIKFINPKCLPVSWIMHISSINNIYRQISKTTKSENTNVLQAYRADPFRILDCFVRVKEMDKGQQQDDI